MMKIVVLWVLFSLQALAGPIQYHRTGTTSRQLVPAGDKLVVINSGYGGQPSLSFIDLNNDSVRSYLLPRSSNPYAGLQNGSRFWLSFLGSDELVSFDMTRPPQGAGAEYPLQRVFQAKDQVTGAESLATVGSQLWLAFNNQFFSPFRYELGVVLVFDKRAPGLGWSKKLNLAAYNPKNLLTLPGKRVAIATGRYENEDGQIIVVNADRLPSEADVRVHPSSAYARFYDTGGVPGPLYFSDERLLSCDLNIRAGNQGEFYQIDLVTQRLSDFPIRLDGCAGLAVSAKYFYLLNLNGGNSAIKARQEHLVVVDRQTQQEVCAVELLPPGLTSPLLAFPSDIKKVDGEGGRPDRLFVSLSQVPYTASLNLNSEGLPQACFK